MCQRCDEQIQALGMPKAAKLAGALPPTAAAREEAVEPEPDLPKFFLLDDTQKKQIIENTLQYAEAEALKCYLDVVANRRAQPASRKDLIHRYKIALRVLEDLRKQFGPAAEPLSPLPAWMDDVAI